MAAPIKKAANQNDLRRLMKERRGQIGSETKRIDSPLAKYDDHGQLSCSICNATIKKESIWPAHIASKSHKNNIQALKQKNVVFKTPQAVNEDLGIRKRKIEGENESNTNAENKQSIEEKINPILPREKLNENDKTVSDIAKLPPGFFDSHGMDVPEGQIPPDVLQNKEEDSKQEPGNDPLPEGFFDDPKLDAKARKVEYKDPMDEEWEKFQKTITAETNVSQAIIEGDMEESKVERDIDEVEEQIHNWARVEALQRRHENLAQQDANFEKSSDGSNSNEEQDFEDLMDWRSKGVWKK